MLAFTLFHYCIKSLSRSRGKGHEVQSSCSILLLKLQVLFEGTRAVGVEYVKDGRLHTMRVRKEVILSAGTIGSPQILMLSGVGHKQHLQQHGVHSYLFQHLTSAVLVSTEIKFLHGNLFYEYCKHIPKSGEVILV